MRVLGGTAVVAVHRAAVLVMVVIVIVVGVPVFVRVRDAVRVLVRVDVAWSRLVSAAHAGLFPGYILCAMENVIVRGASGMASVEMTSVNPPYGKPAPMRCCLKSYTSMRLVP